MLKHLCFDIFYKLPIDELQEELVKEINGLDTQLEVVDAERTELRQVMDELRKVTVLCWHDYCNFSTGKGRFGLYWDEALLS